MSNSRLSSLEVISLANEELASAANSYRLSRQLQILTFVASIASILISNPFTYIPVLAALVAQLSSWGVRLRASRHHAIGDEGRMRGLLLDAIGSTSERIDLANWLSRIDPGAQERATKSVDPNYFASSTPPGIRRLCEHLQENAFWGKYLYKVTAARYAKLLWIFVWGAVLAVLVAIPLSSDGDGLVVARVLVSALSFGAALTQINEIYSWKAAEVKIEAVDR